MTQPNILFLFSDEHSFRFMGHRSSEDGGEPVDTPTFDKLASESTVFSNAYCQVALCTPSRLCLLTGREARNAGAWDNKSVLRPELHTLPGVLSDAGYATCLIGKMHLGGNQQFVGFQHRPYGDLTGNTGHQWEPLTDPERNGIRIRTERAGITEIPESMLQEQVIAQETVAYLREHQHSQPDTPWFLMASFSRPHFPLTAPRRHFYRYWPDDVTEPRVPGTGDAYDHPMSVGARDGFGVDRISMGERQRARAAYFACVSYLDEIIGDLLMRLEHSGLLENTIIVYTTDHGEMVGEHDTWWKHTWHEASTHIPLLISTPDRKSSVCETPAGLIDLFPTLCNLAGVDAPDNLDGTDLSGAFVEGGEVDDHPVFSDNLVPRWGEGTEYRMIRWRKFKYVVFRDCPPLMFDLETDPDEQVNLIGRDVDAETASARSYLEQLADDSMDFDAAEQERTVRDGSLEEQYPLGVASSGGNQYLMPSGKVVEAEDALYRPTIVSDDATTLFGDYSG